jgi:murein DD-endopeptidase MepM/ murein hydrolase activator NlpD
MLNLSPPVRPYRGVRDMDAHGSGAFGASRDGGKRVHRGRDYIALPGDDGLSMIDGVVTRIIQRVYPDSGELMGIEIEGPLVRMKLLYVRPEVDVGQRVRAGQKIGIVQDLVAYYLAKYPERKPITNHVHPEISVWIDPELHLARPRAA